MARVLKPLKFTDGKIIRNMEELKENYSNHQEDIIRLIADGELMRFLDGVEQSKKEIIEKGLQDGKGTTEMAKELADELGVEFNVNVSSRHIILKTTCLKKALENSRQNIDFLQGRWESNDKITISCSYEVDGNGIDKTELRIVALEIIIPDDNQMVIKNIFFRNCTDEEAVIKVVCGKVLFQNIKFEKVRLETAAQGAIKLENCEFMLLTTAALTSCDHSKIEDNGTIKFTKCKEPHVRKKVTNEDMLRKHIDEAIGKFLHYVSVRDKGRVFLENAYEEEMTYWQYAATLQWPEALTLMGNCYYEGIGVKKDLAAAEEYFRQAAEAQYAPGMYCLGVTLNKLNCDTEEAIKWYKSAAEKGYAPAQSKIGLYCYYGKKGQSQNYTEAFRWLIEAANKDNCGAQYLLGLSYVEGRGTIRNIPEGLRLLTMAADKGSPLAEYELWLYINNDRPTALEWLKRAAKHGHPEAQYKLGGYYKTGFPLYGIEKNSDEAQKWYRAAAENGHEQAQKELA